MNLKMYEFEGSTRIWICAENKEQAINLFEDWFGQDTWNDSLECFGDQAVREMKEDEEFTYYADGVNAETDTIKNLINKYCKEPDMFATNPF